MEQAKGVPWADMAASKDPATWNQEDNEHKATPRGLVFSYAGPQELQQARMEAMQIRVKERLYATMMKNKDHGYAGLETCDHDHNDLAKDASGNTSASLFPKPKDMEGSLDQFRSLIVPPVLSRKGDVLTSSAKFVTDGHPGLFQHSSKGPPRLDNPKSVSTNFHISGQDQDKDLDVSGKQEMKGPSQNPQEASSAHRQQGSKSKGTEEAAERQHSGRKHVSSRQGQRLRRGAGAEASTAVPGDSTKGAAAKFAANGSESGSPRSKQKVDAKLLKTLRSSVAAPYVPVTIASGIVPSRGLSTTAGVIGAVKKKVVDNGAILRPLSALTANTLQTRTLQTGPNAANAKEQMSYVGGADIQLPLGVGSRQARAKAEEDAKLSAPLVKVEEVDIVQEFKRRTDLELLGQQQQQRMLTGGQSSRTRRASTDKETGQYEPIDFQTLANSSQAAVAALLQGLIPPEVPPPVPGFESSRPQAHTDRGVQPQLSHRESLAQSELSDRESHAQPIAARKLNEGLKGSFRSKVDHQEQQQQQQQHIDQQELHEHQHQHRGQNGGSTVEQQLPLHSHQQHHHTHHKAATHPSHSLRHAHAPALHEQLPPQRPWPSPQPHQNPLHGSQPAQHPAHPTHNTLQQPPTHHNNNPPQHPPHRHPSPFRPNSASPSRAHSPPWHLASAQLPPQRISSACSSPQSRASSPRRRSAPASAPSPNSNHKYAAGAHPGELQDTTFTSSAPSSTSQSHTRPTSARPHYHTTSIRPTSESPSASSQTPNAQARHIPARQMSTSPTPQHLFASKRPASASAATSTSRPPWRPSSPHHSSSGTLNSVALNSTPAAAAHGVQGSGSEEGSEPMYSWQLTGKPSHRHGTPMAYQLHAAASTPGAAPASWTSPTTEPAPAALPWPINRPLSATSGPSSKRPNSASLNNLASDTTMANTLTHKGVEPPSSEARAAIVQQQQQIAPWPKAANRDRDPTYAMARAANPPLNSTPRFPFSPPPGAPSTVYPTPQPWADTTAPCASPLLNSASTPANLEATAASVVSRPAAVGHSTSSPMGQTVGVGRRGGGLASSRPVSASRAATHEQTDGGGVIHGVPSALQKLELPFQAEQGEVPNTHLPSSAHAAASFRSRPLSAAPAPAASHHHAFLHHSSPSTQRSLSASPQLALDRPSPSHTRTNTAAGQTLPQPALLRPFSGGPSSPMSVPPRPPGAPKSNSMNSGATGLNSQIKAAEVQSAAPVATLRARPQSAVVLSPSGVPSKRARPPTAGLWGRSSSSGSGGHAGQQ